MQNQRDLNKKLFYDFRSNTKACFNKGVVAAQEFENLEYPQAESEL
jgi:hypothetical protein